MLLIYFPDDEAADSPGSEPEEDVKPGATDVADILKRLQSTGALIKKPKQEYRCFTCDEDFRDWEDLEKHLIQHVSLPSVVIDKLPSDDEDAPPSGDENWSDEDEEPAPPPTPQKVTPTKIDISQLLKKTGISLKKPTDNDNKSSDSALNKLSGLGFTIKKSNTPIKSEPEPEKKANDVMQKLGKLGGIKLKLKSDGNNANSFKVINGLKDFDASDNDDEGSGNDESREGPDDDDPDKSGENDSEGENDRTPPGTRKTSESDDSEKSAKLKPSPLKNLQGMSITQKKDPPTPLKVPVQQSKPPARPAVKQTPKRGANLPVPPKDNSLVTLQARSPATPSKTPTPPTPDRRASRTSVENVVVKQEVEAVETQSSNVPIFSSSAQIKSERTSPTPNDGGSTPILATVKSEPDALASHQSAPPSALALHLTSNTTPLLPITKKEEPGVVTVIEINGDSNDEDDDCCVVSSTPAPDVKPVVPKTEPTPSPTVTYPPPAYPTTQPSYSSSGMLGTRLTAPSLEKQHNFNWNAPDSKPPLDMLEKSADDKLESLQSNTNKKEDIYI